MRAITVAPGIPNSVRLDHIAEPTGFGSILVETLALGICGTDMEILSGKYGWAPQGRERLVLGHESLGRVLEAPGGSGFSAGDLIVGLVRRPDPIPCSSCALGETDMCHNGQYTERGIKELDGYGIERFRLEPEFSLRLDPALGRHGVLLEPASVLAKAWEHIEHIGRRSFSWTPRRLLITGAGPIGLLAALFGKIRDLEIHILDRTVYGRKPQLARDLGLIYHTGDVDELSDLSPDIVIECTGAPELIEAILKGRLSGHITCLLGVSVHAHPATIDVSDLNRKIVLKNETIFGSVSANRKHYEEAAKVLAATDPYWLDGLISRRIPLARWEDAFERQSDDIKVVIDFVS